MSGPVAKSATLYGVTLGRDARLLQQTLLVLAGTVLLALSARLQVPFLPVPMTFQTLVVLVLAAAVGWRLAGATLLAYLAQGAAGLPVFAGTPAQGLGLAYMIGPTGGYLVGMLLAALLVGWLAERGWGRTWLSAAAAMLLGTLAIYGPGLLWLGTLLGWDQPILAWGLLPFLPADLLKLALGTVILKMAWRAALPKA